VGGGGEVLKDGVLVPDTVGGEVGHRGQGGLLVFKHHGADEFRLEFDDNSGGAGVLLGWYGEGVDNQEVGGQGGHVGDVPGSGGSREGREKDLRVNGVDNDGRGGLGGDFEAEDAQRT